MSYAEFSARLRGGKTLHGLDASAASVFGQNFRSCQSNVASRRAPTQPSRPTFALCRPFVDDADDSAPRHCRIAVYGCLRQATSSRVSSLPLVGLGCTHVPEALETHECYGRWEARVSGGTTRGSSRCPRPVGGRGVQRTGRPPGPSLPTSRLVRSAPSFAELLVDCPEIGMNIIIQVLAEEELPGLPPGGGILAK